MSLEKFVAKYSIPLKLEEGIKADFSYHPGSFAADKAREFAQPVASQHVEVDFGTSDPSIVNSLIEAASSSEHPDFHPHHKPAEPFVA